MKKYLKFFCLILFALFLTPSVFACDEHVHSLEKGLKFDDNYHWISCKDCDEKIDLCSHSLVSLNSRTTDGDYVSIQQNFEGGKTYCFMFKATGSGQVKFWVDNGVTLNHSNKIKSIKFIDSSNTEYNVIHNSDYASYTTNSGLTINNSYFVFVTFEGQLTNGRFYIENFDNTYASIAVNYNNTINLTVKASSDIFVYKYVYETEPTYSYNLTVDGKSGSPLLTVDCFEYVYIFHGKNCEKISTTKFSPGLFKTLDKPLVGGESYFVVFKFKNSFNNKNINLSISK